MQAADHQFALQPGRELWVGSIEFGKRPFDDIDRVHPPEQGRVRLGDLQRDLGPFPPIGHQPQRLLQVHARHLAPSGRLRASRLPQHLGPLAGCRRLGQRPAQQGLRPAARRCPSPPVPPHATAPAPTHHPPARRRPDARPPAPAGPRRRAAAGPRTDGLGHARRRPATPQARPAQPGEQTAAGHRPPAPRPGQDRPPAAQPIPSLSPRSPPRDAAGSHPLPRRSPGPGPARQGRRSRL